MTVLEAVDSGFLLDTSYRKTTRIGRDIEVWLDWLRVQENRPRTVDQYERDVAKMALLYPELKLREFTDRQIMVTLQTWPAPSRRTRSYALSRFFYWATLTRRIARNPMQWVPPMRKQKRHHIEVFTPAEVNDLLTLPERDRVLMAILFGFGIRKSEAIALQVRRLKVAEHPAHLVVIGGKGDKDRTVHGLPDHAEIVREFLLMNQLEPTDFLWYSKGPSGKGCKRHGPISATSFHEWWKRCLNEAQVRMDAGTRERNPHLARHTFAREWLRAGGRLETLSHEMGHESIKTTFDLYSHFDERDVIADLAVIGRNRA